MQQNQPIEAFAIGLGYPGGRGEALIALVPDLSLPAPLAREIAEAPAQDVARAQFLARRGLARRVIARRLRCDVDAIEISRDANGAPHIGAPARDLHVSLSGRDDLIAVAIADRPVGVDIEPVGAPFELPLNVLHPAERDALTAMRGDAHEEFLRLWTAKEAYLKALGAGLAREPSEIEVRLGPSAKIDGSIHRGGADDVVILDRGARVALAHAFVERMLYRDRPLVLACIALAI